MNLTFSRNLGLGQGFVILSFLIFAIIIFIYLFNLKSNTLINLNDNFNHYKYSQEIKLDVVQVQQYLSDIGATRGEDGLDDGLKEAEKNYKELLVAIEAEKNLALKNKETDTVKVLDEIKKASSVYFETGTKMANLYIKQGTKAGNGVMPQFDKASDELQQKLNPHLVSISNRFHGELSKIEKDITFLFTITIILPIIVLIGFIFFSFYFVKSMNTTFKKIVKDLVDNSSSLESSSLALFEESRSLSQSSTEQAQAIETSVSSVEEMNSTINSNAEFATQAKYATENGVETTKNGIETLNNVISAIEGISKNSSDVIQELQTTNREVSEIVRVIEEIESKTQVINDIVFQTKLLSFNASVEAARAGEHGKGFAVVAEEIGNLSSVSGQAAKEISTLLNEGVSKIKKIVSDSNQKANSLSKEANQKIESSKSVIIESKEVLDNILKNAENIKLMVSEIAVASTQQSSTIHEISSAFSQISQATGQNTDSAESSTLQSEILKRQSEKLAVVIQDFVAFIEGDHFEITVFSWSNLYQLNVSSMDEEHRTLIEKMNSFLLSLNSNNHAQITAAFNDLAGFTVKHFQDEEEYMESINFPDLDNHKKIHKDLIEKVLNYKEGLAKGKLNKQVISNFLKNWLALHIVGQDKKYAIHSRLTK